MNTQTRRKLLVSTSLFLFLAVFVLAAFQVTPAQAVVRTVTLTIDNRANSAITLDMSGPSRYYLKVDGKSIQAFTINRGSYDYTIKGCGRTAKDVIKLNQDTLLINPVCGGSIHTIPKDKSKIDLGNNLKVVPVTISSDLTYRTSVVLTGPSTYVFTLSSGQDIAVTIAKGSFSVQYYACGVNVKTTFQAYKNATLHLKCP